MNGTYNWSPGLFFVQPALCFEPEPVPGLLGPPKGQKIGQKPGAKFKDRKSVILGA
jgi:hypothetical protein